MRRANETVVGARDFEDLNVTTEEQEALDRDRAIKPRVEGLSVNLKRKRPQALAVRWSHASRDQSMTQSVTFPA